MSSAALKYLTIDQFLAQEELAESKSEYFAGQTFAMAGGGYNHSTIIHNLHVEFGKLFYDHDCRVHGSELMVQTRSTYFAYPDLFIVCDPPHFTDHRKRILTNPRVIIEVLSPSTESFDRGAKFKHYRSIPTLTDYLLVNQFEALVEHFVKQADNSWLLTVYEGLDAVLVVINLQVQVPLSDIYRQVTFPTVGSLPERPPEMN